MKRPEVRNLPQVTLIAAASIRIPETIKALQYSMRGFRFAETILFTDQKPEKLPPDIRLVEIPPMRSIDDYSRFMLYEAGSYIKTSHALIVQWDGYVVNPEQWTDHFLEYDYIGALWPEQLDFRDAKGRLCRVGNGGASLRSRRLMEFPAAHSIPWEPGENEDFFLCCKERVELEEHGFCFADKETAAHFAQERLVPENRGVIPFAFHQWEGNNAQYLRLDKGFWFHCRQRIIGWMIQDGSYEKIRSGYLRLLKKQDHRSGVGKNPEEDDGR